MENLKVIGIDIGGTAVKCGVLDTNGHILKSGEFPTNASLGFENLWSNICKYIDENIDKNTLGIAVSGTGQIDGLQGKVIGGNPIIPNWIGTNLVEKLENKYHFPAILENDVNCATIGEKWLGAGKGADSFLCLTIGTGIGGGIILNGELFRGNGFVAGEFGHMQLVKNGKKCLCEKHGCYERYASTTALTEMVYEKIGKKLNGKEIFGMSSDTTIKNIIDEWVDYMTDGLSTLIYIFNPSLIILGGGVTHQGDKLLNLIKSSLDKKLGENYKKNLEIKFASLGNNAGLIGATYLLLKKIGRLK